MNTICSLLLIIIFGLGFFRMRDVLTDKSTEEYQRTQNKVVFLMIDAFRIDFLMSENFTFFQNKLNSSLIFLAVADTPTVTTQRIEAINTGNIPSFIKFGSAFSAKSIKEDNLLYQAKRAGLSTSFLGDDTWISLFPNTLDIQYPSQSFDATDINTNDNIVINNIDKLLGENQTDLLIAHFLGIDHSGHLANDSNIYLWDKQRQYTKVFQKVYEKMSDDSILIIMGDHGMTKGGNHGGASQEEQEVALFITTKYGLKSKTIIEADKFFSQDQPLIPREQFIRKIYQIDIVPTIASLLGISIPYSNIGSIIPEIQNDLYQCKINLYQVWNFVQKIQNSGQIYNILQFKQWKEKLNQVETCQDALNLIYEIQNVSRKVWNEYDFFKLKMSIFGLILIFANLVFEGLKISQKQNWNSNIEKYEIVFCITFILILVIFMFIHHFIASNMSAFMSLLAFYIIKIQLSQLYHNLRRMNFKIFYPTELITFIPYVVLIVDLIYYLLSSDQQNKSQQLILGMMFKQAIIIIISQFQLTKKYILLVLNYAIVLLVQVYLDQYNQSSAYYESESVLKLNFNLNNFYFKYLIPGIFITFYLGSKQQDSKKKIIIQLVLFFINFYYFNQGLHSQINFINKYMSPILVYILQWALILIDFKFISFKIIPIVILVSGQNSLAVFGSLFLCLELFISNITRFQSSLSKGSFIHLNTLFITHIVFYHWYSLGYRQYFSSIQFENAYIGLPQYNFYGTGILLLISLAGIFVVSIFFINDLLHQYINKPSEIIQQNTLIQKIFLIHITFTCFHCYLNVDSEVIYKIYAPKFVYDSLTYLIVIVSQNLLCLKKIKLTNLKQ